MHNVLYSVVCTNRGERAKAPYLPILTCKYIHLKIRIEG